MKNKILIVCSAVILASFAGLAGFSKVQAANQAEIDKAVNYLIPHSSDPWVTMALIASGKTNSGLDYLKTASGSSATDYEKIILAITAASQNPKTFGNVDFVAQLKSLYTNNQIGSTDYLNDDFWGVLALVSAGEDLSSQIIKDSKNFILANQNSDGGFPFGVGWGSDIDDTAAAIMALLEAGVKTNDLAVTKAVGYLKANQNNDGGFPYDPVSPWGTGSNASSDAWVISVINKLGEDPDSSSWSKNGISPVSHLLSLQADSGYFEYQKGTGEDSLSSVTTSYAVIALSQKFYPINKWFASGSGVNNSGGGAKLYTINASAGEHGRIFFSGMVLASAGSDEAFNITPDDGYHIEDVLVDGVSVGAITNYTFTNLGTDHNIAVNFAVNDIPAIVEIIGTSGDSVVNEQDSSEIQAGLNLTGLEGNVINENNLVVIEPVQKHIKKQEQIVIPLQEEPIVAPITPIVSGEEDASPASLLTVVLKGLSFGTNKDWLAIIVIILIIFVLVVSFYVVKRKIKFSKK